MTKEQFELVQQSYEYARDREDWRAFLEAILGQALLEEFLREYEQTKRV